MKKNGHITAFYVETLLLILVFIAIILVLTSIFGMAKAQSREARLLTNAVTLAGNAAEAVSASGSEEELLALLDERDNAVEMPDAVGVIASYDADMSPDPKGKLHLHVTWLPEKAEAGTMVRSTILAYWADQPEPVYRLDTAVFLKEAEQ